MNDLDREHLIRVLALKLAVESHGPVAGRRHDRCYPARAAVFDHFIRTGQVPPTPRDALDDWEGDGPDSFISRLSALTGLDPRVIGGNPQSACLEVVARSMEIDPEIGP